MKIPQRVSATCSLTSEGRSWLLDIAGIVQRLTDKWDLTLGAPFDNDEVSCSWTAPALLKDGSRAVLKLGMPHMEAADEIEGLSFWAGDPAVLLLRAEESLNAMLLERCEPGTFLRSHPEPDQDVVIAGLLKRLWRSPEPGRFRFLSVMTEYWSQATEAAIDRWTDPGLVREGLRLFAYMNESAAIELLLATDLHAGNVLQSQREPWLVIDPKPFVGDPAYDATQHLLNCRERMTAQPDDTISRFSDLLEVEAERVRSWTFARAASEPRSDWDDWKTDLARSLAPS